MGNFKCDKCGRDFDSGQSLLQHSEAKHADPVSQKNKSRPLKINTKLVAATISILAIAAVAYYFYAASSIVPAGLGALGSQHIHADFKLYLNGRAIDLSQQKYQLRSQYVHVESGDGDVVHVHATGVTLGYFLRTIGFALEGGCLTDDLGARHCDSNSSALKVFVNGAEKKGAENYLFRDLDKILVSYGPGTKEEIGSELASITDKARLQPIVE